MPRPCKNRCVGTMPTTTLFKPSGVPCAQMEEINLSVEGLEALRLADLEGLGMDTAACLMGVSRHTFGRVLRKARHEVAQALCTGNALRVEGGVYHVHESSSRTKVCGSGGIMESVLIAVPSDAPGGLDAKPSAHFGHCDAYTIAHVENNVVGNVEVHFNEGHDQGGCLVPVRELADKGVKVLVAGGMGMGPLNAMHQMGMEVYFSAGLTNVGDVIKAYAEGKLRPFAQSNLCQGGCGHHNEG